MTFEMNRGILELEYRDVIPLKDAKGARIDCLSGRIWITEDGCTDDIVLEAGESYEISHGGAAVLQALREAAVALRGPVVVLSPFDAPICAPAAAWLRAPGPQPDSTPAR